MIRNFFLVFVLCCLAASISAKSWKTNTGKSPHLFLDINIDDLKKECESKQESIRDTKMFAAYFKRYKEIQEEILKKVKVDPKTNIDNMIMEECLTHPELKKQIANVTDTLELCLVEGDRLERAMKDKVMQEVLEIKCANLKKAVIVRSEEKCIKKEPPMCLEMFVNIQNILIPVPVKYPPQLCGEIMKLRQCKNMMTECKEETRKALDSFVSDEMALVGCADDKMMG